MGLGKEGFTEETALKTLAGTCKIVNSVITVPAKGIGLRKLAAIDYIERMCKAKYVVRFEHQATTSDIIPLDKRGKMISGRV